MSEALIALTPWERPVAQAATVRWGYGFAILFWPSGVRTLEQYGGAAVITDVERHRHREHFKGLARQKVENLFLSLADFRARQHPDGWWIRTKKGRQQARRVKAVAYLHPESYDGPPIGRGGVISA